MISEQKVQAAIDLMKLRTENYNYFFNNITSSSWISPLAARGFFAKPPNVVRENGYITLPIWPESRYLARIASQAPEEVSAIFLNLPDTENVRVFEDMALAALSMPVSIARLLAGRITEVTTRPYSFVLPGRIVELALKFYRSGFVHEGSVLFAKLLTLELHDSNGGIYSTAEVAPAIGKMQFEQVLGSLTVDVTPLIGIEALSLISDTLTEYFSLTTNPRDTEYLWLTRPAIEDHQQNIRLGSGTLDLLVDATRDISLGLIKTGQIASVLLKLDESSLPIFKRIAMHALTCIDEPRPEWIASHLLQKDNFDSRVLHHEYYMLQERHFDKLPRTDQETILRWINELDDPAEVQRLRTLNGTSCSETEAIEISKYRKLTSLFPIHGHLFGDFRTEYESLVERYGRPDHPEFLSYHQPMRRDSILPIHAESLQTMSPSELVQYIRNWVPSIESARKSMEHEFGRQIEDRVKTEPATFALSARLFLGLPSTYVRSFFGGLRDSVRTGTRLAWEPVLELATWAIMQADEHGSESTLLSDSDVNWSWSRTEIAHLLVAGLGSQNVEPSIDCRATIWNILETLASDSDPTPSYEESYVGDNLSPPALALNTIRPMAIRGVILYALWAYRQSEDVQFSFASIPEAGALLARHLDSSKDPSLAVRSVYGELSPFLVKIDEKWFEVWRSTIFDRAEGRENYWHAAWDTYVTHCQPYDRMLVLLQEEYIHAVDLTNEATLDGEYATVSESLGVHLLMFYGRRQLDLRAGGLMEHFLEGTTPGTRKLGLVGLGQLLLHAESVEPAFANRFIPLWDLILENALKAGREQRTDLAAFGWWFGSGGFDSRWAMKTLLNVLELAPSLDLSHRVVEKLAELASAYPSQALQALVLLFQFQDERMNFYERTEIVEVLEHALGSESRDVAVDFIHLLGAAGIEWPRKLLSTLPD
jgi:hypothetical protein